LQFSVAIIVLHCILTAKLSKIYVQRKHVREQQP